MPGRRARTRPPQRAVRPPRFKAGDTIGGRYRIYGCTRGGIGDVYFCVDLPSGLPLALKTLQPMALENSERQRRLSLRFEDEVRLWAELGNHPNIVRCHYFTVEEGVPFICMEWVVDPGRTGSGLGSFVASHGPLGLRLSLDLAIDICRGLLFARETHPGFVHRDLKPENVLVTQTRTAKVTDFGFALISPREPRDRESHSPDLVVGTPSYMAPEQWSTGRVDSRADVYALGCILFKMLTGHGPFHGASERDEWSKAHRETPAPMLPPSLPSEVNELVQRCLRKLPGQRFEDIEALHAALTELYRAQLRGEPREAPQANEMTAEDLNNLGNTFFHLGDLARAIVEYEHAIEANPCLAAIHYGRAGALHGLGRFEEAIAGYGEALRLDPSFANAAYNRGNVRRDLGDQAAAIKDYTLAAELDPELGVALHNRGLLHLQAGRRVEAVGDFRAAISASKVADAYRSLAAHHRDSGQLTAAAEELDRLLEQGGATGADYVARARLRRALGQFSNALGDFNAAITMGEERFPLLYERALCLRSSGRPLPAIADLTLLLKYERTNLPALRARAALFHDLDRFDDALGDYSLITTLDENDTDAYYSIGLVLGERGQFENAFAFLREAARRGHNEAGAALRRFGLRSSVAGVPAPVPEGHP